MNDKQSLSSLRTKASAYSDPVSHDEMMSALEAAKTGSDAESARNLMAEILRQLRAGSRSVTPYLENWIIHAFTKILVDGASFEVAFGFKSGRGQYERPDTHDRDLIAAALVVLEMRSGKKWTEAIGDAANQLFEDGIGDKAVQAAYTKYHQALSLLPTTTLAAIIQK